MMIVSQCLAKILRGKVTGQQPSVFMAEVIFEIQRVEQFEGL